MKAEIIDGKAVAAEVRERVAAGVGEFAAANDGAGSRSCDGAGRRRPGVRRSTSRNKRKQTEAVGMRSIHEQLGAGTPEDELLELVAELNGDDSVDGILVQLPLPDQIDPDAVIAAIDPGKDVDGLTPVNAGLLAQGRPGLVPCTPTGCRRADRARRRRCSRAPRR